MQVNSQFTLKKLNVLQSSVVFFKDIKLVHSVFALPFAAIPLVLNNFQGLDSYKCFLLLSCMITARSFAMGINRFLDRYLDQENPRTASRMIPSGHLTSKQSLFWTLMMGLGFIFSAFFLSQLAGWLSLPLLMILAFYSNMKKISWLTHWYLGLCLGLAPIAVNLVMKNTIDFTVILLGCAVMMWTAGFDILYALQDKEFDIKHKLQSVPAKWGPRTSVYLSRFCFMMMIFFLALIGIIAPVGYFYYIGVFGVSFILMYEQWLVREVLVLGYSDQINKAFFTVNGWVSVFFYCLVHLDHIYKI